MTIQEIFQLATANDVISELKSCRFIPQPDVESANKALDPKLHDIMSPIMRPDKRVQVSADDEADSAGLKRQPTQRMAIKKRSVGQRNFPRRAVSLLGSRATQNAAAKKRTE